MSRLPPLSAVRVFEAAARLENYSRAAEELAMTQAGVSYQIRLLEDRLGAKLFIKSGRGIALTPLGRRIAPQVSEAFAALGHAFAAVRDENEAVLNVSTSVTFATQWLAARLGTFHLKHPRIAVRLDASNSRVDLHAGEVDVAIRGIGHPGPDLVSHFLMRQCVVPMASPGFLATHPIHSEEDLRAAPRISPGDEWWELWLGKAPGATPTTPQDRIRFDSQVLDGQAALAGQGVAMMSPAMFGPQIASGQLVILSDRAAFDRRNFWLCYAAPKQRLAKVRAFRDWLLGEVQAELASDCWGALELPVA